MSTIAILGCGWLGLPLALSLINRGHNIHGATTSPEKALQLADIGIDPYVIKVLPEAIQGHISQFLKGCDTLIITIPPGKSGSSYSGAIKQIVKAATVAGIENVLFTSSISVYPNEARTFTESDQFIAPSESAAEMLRSEQAIRAGFPKATILRLGGLAGADRQPARFVGQSKPAEHPDAPINLVHLDDCIEIIGLLIRNRIWNETFNVVAPYHPSRKEYYSRKAKMLNLPAPRFADACEHAGKLISSERIINKLNYTFSITTDL